MTVAELIAKLSTLDPKARIVTPVNEEAEYYTGFAVVEQGWFGGPRSGEFHRDDEVEEGEYTGFILCEWEDGESSRLYVKDGKVTEVKAVLTWPEV